jgi:hypothetical protein
MRSRRWRTTKISGFDPSLMTVWTPDSAEPLLAFLHPPVELAASGPHGQLDLDRWVHFSAIGCVSPLHLGIAEIHI